jgi:hypothetical protein
MLTFSNLSLLLEKAFIHHIFLQVPANGYSFFLIFNKYAEFLYDFFNWKIDCAIISFFVVIS